MKHVEIAPFSSGLVDPVAELGRDELSASFPVMKVDTRFYVVGIGAESMP